MSDKCHECRGCGGTRPSGYVACRPCWIRLPFTTRRAFSKADLAGKRELLRTILPQLQQFRAEAKALS